jgi:hypothetical protein
MKETFSVRAMPFLLAFFLSCTVQGQTITGRVLDAKTSEALPFANVFINNTTVGAVTDANGYFSLSGIQDAGTYEVVFSFVGYETYKVKVALSEGVVNLDIISLKPSEIQLATVEVTSKRDKQWEKDLKKFKRIFLGQDKQAMACEIINPWVIDFPKEETGKRFLATASDPIGIENKALGYRVIFYLTDFHYDSKGYSIAGNARFTELKSQDAEELALWETNRRKGYRQSTHYLFKAMIDKRIRGEGFSLYRDGVYIENVITRSDNFNADLGRTVFAYDTTNLVLPGKKKDTYSITIKDRMEVHDNREKSSTRIYQDVFGPVSWISLRNQSILVDKNGFPLRPEEVTVSGDLSDSRVANLLPLDYKPNRGHEEVTKKLEENFWEQISIHTDKPYYYPGERIWFKGYVNYARPAWRDSLSRTVYVELVDRDQKMIVLSKTLPIEKGTFANDFSVPDSLKAKAYYLRAYTQFNRNFGDENLYVKPLPILNLKEEVRTDLIAGPTLLSDRLVMETDKDRYKPRDKINLTIRLEDEQIRTGSFSIAVLDTKQVAPITSERTILDDFPIQAAVQKTTPSALPFSIERGITFSGKFINEAGTAESAMLSVFQLKPPNFTLAQSDVKGMFTVSGLAFYDTAAFSIQAIDDKGKAYGKAVFITPNRASINFAEAEVELDKVSSEFVQRVPTDNDFVKGTQLLKEVVVESNPIEEEYQKGYRLKRSYGKPDYVLKEKDINSSYGNLLQTLPGKVPGLVIREVNNAGEGPKRVVYIERGGRNSSLLFPKEVMVTINDAVVSGTPEEILSAIDPSSVESVEVSTSVNVLYGAAGGNGIVSVYTKRGYSAPDKQADLVRINVPGYARAREFKSPNYEDELAAQNVMDYRSTLYWNPYVITDSITGSATVSFFAANRAGTYRIVVEGITEKGEPIRSVSYIEVQHEN